MIAVATLKAMAAAGCSTEQIIATIEAEEKAGEEKRAEKREQNRIRQQNHRARNAMSRVTECDDALPLDKEKVAPKETKPLKENPPKGGQKKSFATRIPDDFAPDIEWAVAHGLSRQTAQFQAEKFRNYWLGAKQGAKADWPATWRNWVLSHIERSGADAPIQASSESSDEQWSKRLIYARKERVWSTSEWGAPPGAPGCRVPRQLVEPGDGDGWKEWVKAA